MPEPATVFLPGVKDGELDSHHAFVLEDLCRLALEMGARPQAKARLCPEDALQ